MRSRFAVLGLFILTALAIAGCGAGETGNETLPTNADTAIGNGVVVPATGDGNGGKGGGQSSQPSDASREAAARDAQAAYRSYIAAINARDGAALCDLLSPAGVRELKAPVERATCPASLHDSIGYSDPRGSRAWKHTSLGDFDETQVSADLSTARVTAGITTNFADGDQPSIEDDIAYLERVGGKWRLAKPSGALYRAVGNAEPPPSVTAPPQG